MENHKNSPFSSRVCLIGLFCLLLAYLPAKAVADFSVGRFDYKILSEKDLTVEATPNATSFDPIVVVPQTVTHNDKTYRVTALGDKAFYNKNWATSVTLPESITRIGDETFSGCYNLKTIVIPLTLTRIGSEAFSRCYNLETVFLPNSITEIGASAFSNCEKLETINIPTSLTKIEEKTFYNCKALQMIDIPGVTSSIGNYAFAECENLEALNLSQSVKDLGNDFIKGCNNLIEINVAEGNPFYASLMGILYNKELSEMILAPKGIEFVELPPTVKTIPDDFFAYSRLTMITIPNSLTKIGDNAFAQCKNLTSIVVPNSVTEICSGAFSDCTSLENILLPENLITIKSYTFYECKNLESIQLPSSLTSIGSMAFRDCEKLNNVEIPDNVTSLGSYCFSDCQSLASIKFPAFLEEIDQWCFHRCGFKSLELPSSIKMIYYNAFSECEELETVYFPEALEYISPKAFQDCFRLNNLIISQENPFFSTDGPFLLNKAGNKLLAYPMAAGDVVVPEGLTEVGQDALTSSSIASITFSSTIREIESQCFEGDKPNIKWIKCLSTIPPETPFGLFSDNAFIDILYLPTYVPAESVPLYRNATYWRNCEIIPIAAGIENNLAEDHTSNYVVYSLDGSHVLTTTDHSRLNELPAGIYIINGKKKLIK